MLLSFFIFSPKSGRGPFVITYLIEIIFGRSLWPSGMSLCTLPVPVSPDHLAISPQIDVVLFTTDTHLMLCRRSGQQVWSARLPLVQGKVDAVSSIAWSPDGHMCAIVTSSGSVVNYDVSSGRPVAQGYMKKMSNISSVAWSPQISQESILKSVAVLAGDLSAAPELGNGSTFAAFGSRSGTLKISLFGALDLDEISLNNSGNDSVYLVVANEVEGEYAAIQGTCLYVYRNSIGYSSTGTHTEKDKDSQMMEKIYEQAGLNTSQEKITTHQGAVAIVLADKLLTQCDRLQETLIAIRETNYNFIQPYAAVPTVGDPAPDDIWEELKDKFRRALLSASMTGKRNPQLKAWVQNQHEQGFKRWYKNQSQNWDALNRIATQDLLPVLIRLIAIWRLLKLDSDATHRLHILVSDVILTVVPRRELFELQAGYLEYLFRDEIDRPIAVTRLSSVPVQKVGRAVLNGELLGDLDASLGYLAHEIAEEIHGELGRAVAKIRSRIKGKFALSFKRDLGEKATHICHNSTTKEFKVILQSGKVIRVSSSGSVSKFCDVSHSCPSFIGDTDDIICLDNDTHSIMLSNGITVPLEFPAISVTARRENQQIIACVLSEDCQHYQFIKVEESR